MMLLNRAVPNYVVASIAVSVGGFVNGYDTGSIGAVVSMSQFTKSIGSLSPSMLGFTVSLIMLTGAIPSVFAGQLSDRFGRLKAIISGAIVFVVGAVLQASAGGLPQFLLGRALAGFGEGIYLGNMSVYICEVAPMKHRGALAGLPQFLATAGVCCGYFTCYGTVHVRSSIAWRLPFLLQSGFGISLFISCFLLPDSPRWLILHGKHTEAMKALERLNFSMIEAQEDMLRQSQQASALSLWQGFLLLFRRGYRSRTILGLFMLGMVQLSGIDGVLYVSWHHRKRDSVVVDAETVRTHSLQTSRITRRNRHFSCFRPVCDSNAGDFRSGFPVR
jgi:MFS family permease